MKKYYVVPAEVIETNFPDDMDTILQNSFEIYMPEKDKREAIINEMKHYLSNDESELDKVLTNLEKANEEDPYMNLESVDDILVWQKVEGKFTVGEFCELIGLD